MTAAAEGGPDNAGPLRLLSRSAALLWGLHYSLLYPSLAYVLVNVYGAGIGEVGWILGLYAASGLLASLITTGYAERHADTLRPVLVAGCLMLVLAIVLGLVSSLPVAVITLTVLGGPAGVGSALLSSYVRRGAVGGRFTSLDAAFAIAWVLGPPLAMLIISVFGPRSVLVAVAFVAVLAIATIMFMINLRPAVEVDPPTAPEHRAAPAGPRIAVMMLGLVILQASGAAVVSIMSLFVVETLGLDIVWAGVALGLAAAVQIPALLVVRTLAKRSSGFRLTVSGCLAGVVYCAGMTLVHGPVMLVVLQILGGWSIAAVSGLGPAAGSRPDTRRIGAVVAGPVIALSAVSPLGYRGVFLAGVALAMTGLGCVLAARFIGRVTPGSAPRPSEPGSRST